MKQWMPALWVIIGVVMVFPVSAGLNKWVDEDGQVHYGDRVPAKYLKQQREILNEQGVVVKKHDAAKSDEELEKARAQRAKRAEADKRKMIEAKKAALRDRVLLATFTTEDDLIHQRDARLEAVDTQILLTETIIKDQEKKLENLKKRIGNIEKSDRKVPENLHKEQASVTRQLQTHHEYVDSKNKEKKKIISKFEDDIKRFRELMEQKKERKQR